MKDLLIIGLAGLAWQLMPHRGELITVVLFALLVAAALARPPRSRDVLVICGVGLLWEAALTDNRSWVTIGLFGLPLCRLLRHALTTQQDAPTRGVRQRLLDGLVRRAGRATTREFALESVAALGMLGLGAGAAIYLTRGLGVSQGVIGYGALSYALGAVGFKGLLYSGVVVPVLHERLSAPWLAAAQGFVSAVSELGAAALFFRFVLPELSVPQLIGFGAAAGIVEALVVPLMSIGGMDIPGGTPVERSVDEQWHAMGATPFSVMVFPVVERGLTMALHASSRALVYAAMVLGDALPALLAVLSFAAVDGLAYYALLRKWKVLSFTVAIPFYGFIATAAAVLSLVFWRLHDSMR